MKEKIVNTLEGGLKSDLSTLNALNNVLTYAENLDFISTGDDEFIAQGYPGQKVVGSLSAGLLKPIAVSHHDGIAYICSVSTTLSDDTTTFEIGTFPSPNWDILNAGDSSALEYTYRPLHNFFNYDLLGDIESLLDNDVNYTSAFRTEVLPYTIDTVMKLELQPSYDGSMNILLTDGETKPRIVNSRFTRISNSLFKLAERNQDKDENTYSNENIDRTLLIEQSTTIPNLKFLGVKAGGSMIVGNYKFYFKYEDSEGNLSDIFEESRTVSVFYGTSYDGIHAGKVGETTNKYVQFYITDLDSAYSGVQVYYEFSSSETSNTPTTMNKITSSYDISGSTCTVRVTGEESTVEVDSLDVVTSYSQVSSAESFTQSQDRLLLANIKTQDIDYGLLQEKALLITMSEISEPIKEYVDGVKTATDVPFPKDLSEDSEALGYADPNNIYYNLGYWKGETYELGIVCVLDTGLSTVLTINGMDNYSSTSQYINENGIWRTRQSIITNIQYPEITRFKLNFEDFKNDAYVKENVLGIFVVRRERSKDALYEGIVTSAFSAPAQSYDKDDIYITWGTRLGIGQDLLNAGDIVHYPCPGNMMEFATDYRTIHDWMVPSGTTGKAVLVHAMPWEMKELGKGAFYSGDIIADPLLAAPYAEGNGYGLIYFDAVVEGIVDIPVNTTDIGSIKLYKGDATHIEQLNITKNSDNYFLAGIDSTFVDTAHTSSVNGAFVAYADRNLLFEAEDDLWPRTSGDITTKTEQYEWKSLISHHAWRNTGGVSDVYKYAPFMAKYGSYVGIEFTDGEMPSVLFNALTTKERTYVKKIYHYYPEANFTGTAVQTEKVYSNFLNWDSNIYAENYGIVYENDEEVGTPGDFLSNFNPHITYELTTGVLAKMYRKTSGARTYEDLEVLYDNDTTTEYFAISKRIALADLGDEEEVFGGDCFVNPVTIQYSYGLGIPTVEDIANHDPEAYEDDWVNAGLTPLGMAMTFTCQNNFNTMVRNKEYKSIEEHTLYGQDRSYLPEKSVDEIKGSRQLETTLYNHGFNDTLLANSLFKLDPDSPIYSINYPNRVMASKKSITTSFANGYRDFTNSNYVDYEAKLGAIKDIVTVHDKTYIICTNGIGMLAVSDRTLIGNADSIKVDTADILPAQIQTVSNSYGVRDKSAVMVSSLAIYGVDVERKVIWSVKGGQFTLMSKFQVQSLFDMAFDACTDDDNIYPKIQLSADTRDNKLYFTLKSNTDDSIQYTLYYNEDLDTWISMLDKHPLHIWHSRGRAFEFNSQSELESNIMETKADLQQSKYGDDTYNVVLEFVVNNVTEMQKELDNLQIVGSKVAPYAIEYFTHDDNTGTSYDTITDYQLIKIRTESRGTNFVYSAGSTSSTVVVEKVYNNNTCGDADIALFENNTLYFGQLAGSPRIPVYQNITNVAQVSGLKLELTVDTPLLGTADYTEGSQVFIGYPTPLSSINAEFLEDSLYIVVERGAVTGTDYDSIPDTQVSNMYGFTRTIRDKAIRVRLTYNNLSKKDLHIQKIISSISTSYV